MQKTRGFESAEAYIFWSCEGLSQKGQQNTHLQEWMTLETFFLSPRFLSLNSTAVIETTKQTDQAVNNHFIVIDILPRHSVGYAYASLSKSLNDATNKTHRCLNMTLAAPVMPDSSGLGKRTAPPLRVDMPQVGALRRRCLFVSPPITEPQWVVSNTGERQQTAS